MKTNLIGISGKMGSGKDEIFKIIQKLTYGSFENRKFADQLKDTVCMWIGCSREQLEDIEFKEKELGEEWRQYFNDNYDLVSKEESTFSSLLTPRKLLQLLGTECGRNIIHPNIWVNALFADYNSKGFDYKGCENKKIKGDWIYPNWIITDVRFPNEAKAIKDRGGIVIRVNRYCYDSLEDYLVTHPDKEVSKKAVEIINESKDLKFKELEERLSKLPESKGYYDKSNHPSETALDDYEFDYVIDNNGSIEELVEKIKQLNLV